jgi:hypothetical protein
MMKKPAKKKAGMMADKMGYGMAKGGKKMAAKKGRKKK